MIGPAPAKINLALVVGPLRDDGKHELATVYQRVDLGDRITRRARRRRRRSRASPDTIVRARARRARRAARLARPHREAHTGRRRARRRQLRRRDRAAARERAARRAAAAGGAARARRAGRRRRAVLPRTTGRSSARGDGTTLEPLDLPQDFAVLLVVPNGAIEAVDAPTSTRRSTRAAAREGYDERARGAARRARGVRRPRDLAALPPNDLASSPLAGELVAAGAFRADVTRRRPGGLRALPFARRRRRAPRRVAAAARSAFGSTVPAWYG